MDAPDELDRRYNAIVERISRFPVTDPATRAEILAEIEAAYRRDRAAGSGTLGSPSPAGLPGEGGT